MYLSSGPDNLVNEMNHIKPTLLFSVQHYLIECMMVSIKICQKVK